MAEIYIAKNIKTLRAKKRITQDRLASYFKKGVTTISNWENDISTPSIEEIVQLSNIFGISVDDFIKNDFANVHPIKISNKAEIVHSDVHSAVHPTAEKAPIWEEFPPILQKLMAHNGVPTVGLTKTPEMLIIVDLCEKLTFLQKTVEVMEGKIMNRFEQLTKNGS